MKTIQTEGALFEAVQRTRLFPDSKTFVDAQPRFAPETIEHDFRALLTAFVEKNFVLPAPANIVPKPQATLAEHIDALWAVLTRSATTPPLGSSLIPLPAPYVVPGGRFDEMYYWDSYFSALGWPHAGRTDLLLSLAQNFSALVERLGYIPNGSRSYFTRSQPPFFSHVLELVEMHLGFAVTAPFLPSLEREYQHWMRQGEHAVRLPDGSTLNRYWDACNLPREESLVEDLELAEQNPQHLGLHRERRAGAESGWDFSSRWNQNPHDPGTIRTTALAPVDLNCLLYHVEVKLGEWLQNPKYGQSAEARKNTMLQHCWDETQGWFFDLEHASAQRSEAWTLAGVFPLFVGIATPAQAARVAEHLEQRFLRPGGLVTTLLQSGEQWDAPNGWAPLQWVACLGLERYGHAALARSIAQNFVQQAERVWQRTGRLMEKYNVENTELEAGGGEYPAQDGFGWTNGVVRALMARYGF